MAEQITKLKQYMVDAVRKSTDSKKIGIAFSGGVDSSLLAKMCSDIGFDLVLLTIGFDGSHDIEFSKKIAIMLKLKHLTFVIPTKSFFENVENINQKIKTDNLSWNENCIAFYYVSKFAQSQKISTVLTSNGLDELFCGYDAYRRVIENGESAVLKLMDAKLDNELQMMKAINQVTSEFGVKVLQPFLSKEFIEFAKQIPVKEKIKDKNDLIRKHIIRNLAITIGVPEASALKRKKALQYGSLIHKNMIKARKT